MKGLAEPCDGTVFRKLATGAFIRVVFLCLLWDNRSL